ncbi:MAG: hypothetical protein ABEK50_10320, partial [bacterium]
MGSPIERFNELAEKYEEFRDTISKYDEMNSVMLEVFDSWNRESAPKSICELGCGTGTMASLHFSELPTIDKSLIL